MKNKTNKTDDKKTSLGPRSGPQAVGPKAIVDAR